LLCLRPERTHAQIVMRKRATQLSAAIEVAECLVTSAARTATGCRASSEVALDKLAAETARNVHLAVGLRQRRLPDPVEPSTRQRARLLAAAIPNERVVIQMHREDGSCAFVHDEKTCDPLECRATARTYRRVQPIWFANAPLIRDAGHEQVRVEQPGGRPVSAGEPFDFLCPNRIRYLPTHAPPRDRSSSNSAVSAVPVPAPSGIVPPAPLRASNGHSGAGSLYSELRPVPRSPIVNLGPSMNRRIRSVVTLATFALVTTVSAQSCAGHRALAATPARTEANIARLTTNILEQSQFAHHALDRELAGQFLDSYFDALDGTRSLFLQSDIEEFAHYRATLAQAIREQGDTNASRVIFQRYLERLEQRRAYVTEILKDASFDFTGHDTYSLDREKAVRPRDIAAARELWRQQLRAEYLQEKLADATPEKIATKLGRRYQQQVDTMKALTDGEVLEVYLNALAHVYDPHSDYLGHEQMESLSISMSLSLFGIGASLESVDGYCTIREVLPGGPAARSGVLRPGDRIVTVTPAGKEPVDIVNMPLSRAVTLIRGPKGTIVTLTVLAAGASDASVPRTVRLVRDKIKLEDQEAKARILDLTRPNNTTLRLGVIELPEFYAGIGQERQGEGRSVTSDVALLLSKLKAEKVQGVILDVRQNGGGSLQEAISLTGLFIKKGPVVQTRGSTGSVSVESDPDPSVVYDGPLVVLTSRFSASATEILAGALQDYGRAVIVGDSQTFGKGTVQTILPLGPVMDKNGVAHAYDPGALKITISKFYRPGGSSTQLRGVSADVVLPSISDFSDVSESALKNALPWGAVPAADYRALNRVKPYLEMLRQQSAVRRAKETSFAHLRDDVTRLKKNFEGKTVSLNEAERRQELTQAKARKAERERETASLLSAQPKTYKISLKNVAVPGLPPASSAKDDTEPDRAAPVDDSNDGPAVQELAEHLTLDEGVKILADYAELSRPAKSQTAATP
jgi:carboxyl-terminal processing protease